MLLLFKCSSLFSPLHRTAHTEHHHIRRNDGRTDGGARRDGDQHAAGRAHHGQHSGADGHLQKAVVDAHGRKRREDHQGRDQQRSHQVHGQHDDHRDHHGDQQVIGAGVDPRSPRKGLVEGHREDLVVEEDEQRHHSQGQHRAERHVAAPQRQDGRGAEQRAAHVAGQIGRGAEQVQQQIADRQRSHGDHGDGGVTLDLRPLAALQQQHRAQHGYGQHDDHPVRHVEDAGDGDSAERHMGQAVADKREAL